MYVWNSYVIHHLPEGFVILVTWELEMGQLIRTWRPADAAWALEHEDIHIFVISRRRACDDFSKFWPSSLITDRKSMHIYYFFIRLCMHETLLTYSTFFLPYIILYCSLFVYGYWQCPFRATQCHIRVIYSSIQTYWHICSENFDHSQSCASNLKSMIFLWSAKEIINMMI